MNTSNDNSINKPPTKKEKRILKKQKKEQERLRLERRKKVKKLVSVLSILVLIAVGAIFGLVNYMPSADQNKQESGNQGSPRIEIAQKEYNAGTVSMAGGLIKHVYEIKNTGTGDLKIDKIRTSCMCTTAILRVRDKKSPKFGMHNNPVFWSQKIAPMETGYLEVIFDPAFHGPRGIGSAVRFVYLSTNDPKNREVKVKLFANVVR